MPIQAACLIKEVCFDSRLCTRKRKGEKDDSSAGGVPRVSRGALPLYQVRQEPPRAHLDLQGRAQRLRTLQEKRSMSKMQE